MIWPFAKREPHTVVFLRSMETPAEHWEDVVCYDAWGSPYVKGLEWGSAASGTELALHKDGKTSDSYLYGTEWRHKSGPPVRFPPAKPQKPFPQSERTGA